MRPRSARYLFGSTGCCISNLIIAATLPACNATTPESSDVQDPVVSSSALTDDSGFKSLTRSFAQREIPVCITANTIDDWANRGWSRARATKYWAHMISKTWTQATGVTVVGWDKICAAGGNAYQWNVGTYPYGDCPSGQSFVGYAGSTPYSYTSICPNHSFDTVRMLVHEAGHVLGFDHEFKRKDFPAIDLNTCPHYTWQPDVTRDWRISTAPFESLMPDPFSVMNAAYCHDLEEISYQDITGAQNLWGRPTYFADVTGDGADDAIATNSDGVYVIANNLVAGQNFTSPAHNWGGRPGRLGTFFADVDGDHKADLITLDKSRGYYAEVRLSNGSGFGTPKTWATFSTAPGVRGVYVADIDGDGRSDLLLNRLADFQAGNGIDVMYSTGTAFMAPYTLSITSAEPLWTIRGAFADVTGPDADGKSRADYIYGGVDGIYVAQNNGPYGFGAGKRWMVKTRYDNLPDEGAIEPPLPILFADVDGDGKDDYITTTVDGWSSDFRAEVVTAYSSMGFAFSPSVSQSAPGLILEKGLSTAKLTAGWTDKRRSMVWVNRTGIYGLDRAMNTMTLTGSVGPFYQTGGVSATFWGSDSNRFGDGDWDPGYYKATCGSGETVAGMSKDPADSYAHAVYCMKRTDSATSSVAVLAVPGDHQRGRHPAGNKADWDPGYYKLECGTNEFVMGVSQSTAGKFHAIRCGSGITPGTAGYSVIKVDGGSPINDWGDWDYGYYKASCGSDRNVVGVSVNPNTGRVHAVLCYH